MFKRKVKVDAALIVVAEEISDELAALTSPLEGVAWEIDSALSAIRKDTAGFRIGTKAEPNGGESYTPGELELAVKRGKQLLLALSAVRELEKKWAQEDAADAARRTGIQGPLAFSPCASLA